MSIVGTHKNADCLLKNTPTKHIKYAVNQKLEHFNDVNFRDIFVTIRVVVFQIKISPFLNNDVVHDIAAHCYLLAVVPFLSIN